MSYARQMLDTYPRTLNLDPGLLAVFGPMSYPEIAASCSSLTAP